jgi:hypothetical protein
MYKIQFDAADVDWQIQMLRIFPEIANKHFYPAMHRATNALAGAIQPNIPHQSGLLQSKFRKAVSGKGLLITARVGFPNFSGVAYVVPLEYGAKPHPIGYVPSLGVTIRMHPGMPARRFIEHGFQQTESQIESEMENAMRGVVDELAKD